MSPARLLLALVWVGAGACATHGPGPGATAPAAGNGLPTPLPKPPTPPGLLGEGQPAPDVGALDQDGHPLRLRDLRGKLIVLWFYPKDRTPG